MDEVFWCVKERDSLDAVNDPWGWRFDTISIMRSDSISEYRDYAEYRKHGLARCVKVTIQEVDGE